MWCSRPLVEASSFIIVSCSKPHVEASSFILSDVRSLLLRLRASFCVMFEASCRGFELHYFVMFEASCWGFELYFVWCSKPLVEASSFILCHVRSLMLRPRASLLCHVWSLVFRLLASLLCDLQSLNIFKQQKCIEVNSFEEIYFEIFGKKLLFSKIGQYTNNF